MRWEAPTAAPRWKCCVSRGGAVGVAEVGVAVLGGGGRAGSRARFGWARSTSKRGRGGVCGGGLRWRVLPGDLHLYLLGFWSS